MALPAPVDGAGAGLLRRLPGVRHRPRRPGQASAGSRSGFPWLGTDGDRDVRAWATLCTPYADDDQGLAILPEVGSQVVVAFEAGNLRRPYIVGCAWNGQAALPHDPEQRQQHPAAALPGRQPAGVRRHRRRAEGHASRTAAGHEVVLDDGAQRDHRPARQRLRRQAHRDRRIEIQANADGRRDRRRWSTSPRRCRRSAASCRPRR